MRRLFGFAAKGLVSPAFAFFRGKSNLYKLSHRRNDSWGVAWVSGAGWELYKEARPLYESEKARGVVSKITLP